jgi:hypothetical protein
MFYSLLVLAFSFLPFFYVEDIPELSYLHVNIYTNIGCLHIDVLLDLTI